MRSLNERYSSSFTRREGWEGRRRRKRPQRAPSKTPTLWSPRLFRAVNKHKRLPNESFMAKEKENAAPRSLGATQRKRSRESAAVAELPYFRHTMKPRALLVATLVALACVSSVRSQSAGGSSPERQQQQRNEAFLSALLRGVASLTTPAAPAKPRCVPYKLPTGSASFQDYCKTLSMADDAEWDAKYRAAPSPVAGSKFPLTGCVLGCIVGKDSYQRAMRWGAGSWSGKW